jgi:hypothetical protein
MQAINFEQNCAPHWGRGQGNFHSSFYLHNPEVIKLEQCAKLALFLSVTTLDISQASPPATCR